MLKVSDYFNPVSDRFPEIREKFKNLGFWSKAAVVAATIFAGIGTFFLLGMGGLAAYRFTVKKLSLDDYSPVTEKTGDIGRDFLVEERPEIATNKSKVLIEGSRTQFDPKYAGQGRSACTSIALEASQKLLEFESFDHISAEAIDRILDQGVEKYRSVEGLVAEHSSVDNYTLSNYSLRREEFHDPFSVDGDPYSGIVNQFDQMLQQAASSLSFPSSLVITKAPETVVIVCRSPNEFWLFDSHGGGGRKAFVEKFDSSAKAAAALTVKFPYLPPENPHEALQLDLRYNSFNAYAVKPAIA